MPNPTVVSKIFDYPSRKLVITYDQDVSLGDGYGGWNVVMYDERAVPWAQDPDNSDDFSTPSMVHSVTMLPDFGLPVGTAGTMNLAAGAVTDAITGLLPNTEVTAGAVKFRPYVLWVKLDSDTAPTQATIRCDRAFSLDAGDSTNFKVYTSPDGGSQYLLNTVLSGDGTNTLVVSLSLNDTDFGHAGLWELAANSVTSTSDGTAAKAVSTTDSLSWTTGPVPTAIVADAEPPTSLTMTLDAAGTLIASDGVDCTSVMGAAVACGSNPTPSDGLSHTQYVFLMDTPGPFNTTAAPGTVDFVSEVFSGGAGKPSPQITGFPYTVVPAGPARIDTELVDGHHTLREIIEGATTFDGTPVDPDTVALKSGAQFTPEGTPLYTMIWYCTLDWALYNALYLPAQTVFPDLLTGNWYTFHSTQDAQVYVQRPIEVPLGLTPANFWGTNAVFTCYGGTDALTRDDQGFTVDDGLRDFTSMAERMGVDITDEEDRPAQVKAVFLEAFKRSVTNLCKHTPRGKCPTVWLECASPDGTTAAGDLVQSFSSQYVQPDGADVPYDATWVDEQIAHCNRSGVGMIGWFEPTAVVEIDGAGADTLDFITARIAAMPAWQNPNGAGRRLDRTDRTERIGRGKRH